MFSRIKEAARILSTKPAEPEIKSYSRIVLFSGNGERLLDALALGHGEYDKEKRNFWAKKPDGKTLEILIGNGHSLIIEEVKEQDAFVNYS